MSQISKDELIDMLTDAWFLSFNDATEESLKNSLEMVCKGGNLKAVRYLLTQTKLKDDFSIQEIINQGLCEAADRRHLDLVKYLLTSEELLVNAELHACSERALFNACMNNDVEMVKYFLTSKELKRKSNVCGVNDAFFTMIVSSRKLDVVKYLIFDFNLEKTKFIADFLKTKADFAEVEGCFEKRDLARNLNEKLVFRNANNSERRRKI